MSETEDNKNQPNKDSIQLAIAKKKDALRKAIANDEDGALRTSQQAQEDRIQGVVESEDAVEAYTEKVKQQLSLEEQELARRVLARRSLLAFIMRFEPDYQAGWVHKLICEKLEQFLEDVRNQKSPRLMLFMPPRAGKSLIASHYFPAWALGQDASLDFISTSYSSQLAEGFSRKARGLLKEPAYNTVFANTSLDESTQSVGHWMTTEGGGYVAAGVGGGITGKGANILIIDDPVRNQEDADSFTVREMQKGWYESTAYTRLAPGGGVLIIQTRWHLDDLSGWLEDKSDRKTGDKFEVVRFPAIATQDEPFRKKGEALHPDRYDEKAFDRIKKAVGPRTWAALYQQNPVPDDGVYFKTQMFHFYEKLPVLSNLRFYASWDLAIGTEQVNDYTVGIIWAVDPDENIYIVDYRRGRYPADIIINNIIDTAQKHRCEVVTIEKGQILMSIGPALDKSIREARAYSFVIHPMPPGKRDKMLRARSIQARMMQSRVYFPKSFEGSDPHTEMLQFPSAKHDDFVDAMAYIGLYLDEAVPGTFITKPKDRGWRDRIHEIMGANRSSGTSHMSS